MHMTVFNLMLFHLNCFKVKITNLCRLLNLKLTYIHIKIYLMMVNVFKVYLERKSWVQILQG